MASAVRAVPRRGLARSLSGAGAHILLLLVGGCVAFPFAWMVLTALKSGPEAAKFPPVIFPSPPQWGNYALAWQAAPFARYFANSAFVATCVTLSVAVTALFAGYAFGQLRFPGRQALEIAYLATLMIPAEVTLIPNFLMVRQLGWYDSYRALILPWGASALSVFLLTQFFRALPLDFWEAAQIDGCGRWRYLWAVAAPLARAALATVALFAFIGSWNSLLWPLLVTKREDLYPIEVGLQVFLQSEGPHPELLMAASTLAMLPVLALFLAAQRTFVEGVAAGIKA